MDTPFSGIVLLDKAQGESSFSALGELKKHFGTRRVGHAGTLDPMATGLLIALVGPATRCARYFSSLDKVYVGEITFGSETDTDDRTGTPTGNAPLPKTDAILRAAAEFIGEIRQVPPAYSAVHVDGTRAYALARAGEEVSLPERAVTVYDLVCEPLSESTARITVRCSSGTYIRSLARDIGRASGSAAHLSALRRTRVGPFEVDEVPGGAGTRHGTQEITPALLRLDGFTELPVDEDIGRIMRNGGKVIGTDSLRACEGHVVATIGGAPICVGSWVDNRFHYDLVFPVAGS